MYITIVCSAVACVIGILYLAEYYRWCFLGCHDYVTHRKKDDHVLWRWVLQNMPYFQTSSQVSAAVKYLMKLYKPEYETEVARDKVCIKCGRTIYGIDDRRKKFKVLAEKYVQALRRKTYRKDLAANLYKEVKHE